jgi:hypothetical protein
METAKCLHCQHPMHGWEKCQAEMTIEFSDGMRREMHCICTPVVLEGT